MLKVLGIAFALTNVALWFGIGGLRHVVDALAGRLNVPNRPTIGFGLQELRVYFDPWPALWILPLVYTFGFVAVGFLYQPPTSGTQRDPVALALAILLLGFEMTWLALVGITVFCRGPNWNLYWPWEAWEPRIVILNAASFSDNFWWHIAGRDISHTPWIREMPGLLLAVAYFSLGLVVARSLSRGTGYWTAFWSFLVVSLFALSPQALRSIKNINDQNFYVEFFALCLFVSSVTLGGASLLFRVLRARAGVQGQTMAYWRCAILVLLVQVAAIVPVKVLLYWGFNMKYFIDLP